jgi:hypothetical protein
MIDLRWFSVGGLFLDVLGAFLLAAGVWRETIKNKMKLVEEERVQSAAYFGSATPEAIERRPAFRARRIDALLGRWGFVFIILGFLLQLIGNWPR